MSGTRSASAFDAQAGTFESRAGLPAEVCGRVADAIVSLGKPAEGRAVLDLGAGTGDIGLELTERGVPYTALDLSEPMLEVFHERARVRGLAPRLVHADAGERWPVPDASLGVVFGSRSLHWVPPAHLAAEAARTAAAAGAVVLVGRVVRDPESPRARIRAAMRSFLGEEGIRGRSGGGPADESLAACVAHGARRLPPVVVCDWPAYDRPRDSVEDWRRKPGLAGRDVPGDVKARVLERVERFTREAFQDIDALVRSTERYVLEGAAFDTPRSATKRIG